MNTYFDKEDFDKAAIYCSKCDNNYTIQCLTCRTPADGNGNPTGKPSDFVEKGTAKKITHFKQIKAMNIDEFAEWLDKNGMWDNSPWSKWWDEKYCKNCESIMCHYEDSPLRFPAAWCELHDKCKFFPNMTDVPDCKEIIKMWMESEVEG